MKKLTLIVLIIVNSLAGSCQTNNTGFSNLVKDLHEFNAPISSTKMAKEVAFEEISKKLSAEDWKYLKLDSKTWPFQKYYSYEGLGKLKLNTSVVGVIYKRSYFPNDISKEKSEIVLATFKDGKLVSSLPIQGFYGDDITFSSTINQSFEITINHEILKYNKTAKGSDSVKRTEKYAIKRSGEIEKI